MVLILNSYFTSIFLCAILTLVKKITFHFKKEVWHERRKNMPWETDVISGNLSYGIDVQPGKTKAKDMIELGGYIYPWYFELNKENKNFRIFGPDDKNGKIHDITHCLMRYHGFFYTLL